MLRIGFITAIFAIQLVACAGEVQSQPIDLKRAQIFVPSDLSSSESKAVELLVEEIQARTRLRLDVTSRWPRTRRAARNCRRLGCAAERF